MITRRQLNAGLLGAALAPAFASTSSARDKPFEGITLRFGTYGGYWQQQLHELVGTQLEKMGAKMEYVTGTPRDNLAKLIASRGQEPPIDLMELTDSIRTDLQKSGFLVPLNYDNIPNAKPLIANQREKDLVSNWVTDECVVYNTEKFKEAGLPPPEKFEDLFNPKLAGHVSFPEMSYGGVINALIGLTNEFSGGDETNIDAGLDAVKKLNPATFYKTSADLSTQFKSGDIWVAIWHAGWAVRLRKAGLPIGTTHPKVKGKTGMVALGWLGAIKGGRSQKAAETFMNLYLSTPVQETLCRANGIVPVNPDAAVKLQDDPLLKEMMLLTPEQIANAYYADWSKVSMAQWGQKWNRVVLR